jgi:diguanylate cyclase (GGDEF)-like protein
MLNNRNNGLSMNISAFISLVICVAYIPLVANTMSAWPWSRGHKLFFLFLLPAICFSIADYIFHSNLFTQQSSLLIKISSIGMLWTAVQLHCFTSSYFPEGKGRWLIFAYILLAVIIILFIFNYLPEAYIAIDDVIYPNFGIFIIIFILPGVLLLSRNLLIFIPRLRNQVNPAVYNQTASLLLSLAVFTLAGLATLLPVVRKIPLINMGIIIISFVLSYAVVGQKIVDLRFILRRGLIWLIVGLTGTAICMGLLQAIHAILNVELTPVSMAASTMACILALLALYRLRDIFARVMGKAFQGESYFSRQDLFKFAENIQNIFTLKKQGGEILKLVIKAVGCGKAGLLFADTASGDFNVQFLEPQNNSSSLWQLVLRRDNPVVIYLKRHHAPLTRENTETLPEFMGLWRQEKEILETNRIEFFIPLISRDNIIGILILDTKQSGRYSLEELAILQDVTSRISVSLEKEYLTEQLKQREEEVSIISRSISVITSSLDIQGVYQSFIGELQKLIEVDWSAIGVMEGREMLFIAAFPKTGSPWRTGERMPLKGTMAEWVAAHRTNYIDPEIVSSVHLDAGSYLSQHEILSIMYLPLIISNEVIGALMLASHKPDAYNQRQIKLLEQLAQQIAMPVENARLYAKTERMARLDELTGLLNRRSLDEILPSEIGHHSKYGGIFSLVIVDLDSLKIINDRYGHLAGDELLHGIGSVMKNTIREADQAFRYGGDEFAILLPQTTLEAAIKVAERVRQQVTARVVVGADPITVSMGIASWPVDGISASDIIAAADTALYQAKRSGGNCCAAASTNQLVLKNLSQSSTSAQVSEALSILYAIANTVDVREYGNRAHSKQVQRYAAAIAEGLHMDREEIDRVSTCSLLHDIGKIGINEEILNKKEGLTELERQAIRDHPRIGAAIISHIEPLVPCIEGILHHHEKYNGDGYPEGLRGEEIPLESRILAIADSLANLTSEKANSKGMTFDEALDEIKRDAGIQFDPKLVEIFLRMAGNFTMSAESG